MKQFTLPDGTQLSGGSFQIGEGADIIRYPSNWLELASDDDLKVHGITVAVLPDPVPVPVVPQIISDRQFFQQLADMGVITQDEALAAVGPGTLPASLAQLVSALPVDQQFPANMLLKGAVEFRRQHPMVAVLGRAFGWKPEQLDALWTAAAAL